MDFEPLNAKQLWLIIALLVAVCVPGATIIALESSGVLHLSDHQMATTGAVSMIVGVATLIIVYRKWISRIKS